MDYISNKQICKYITSHSFAHAYKRNLLDPMNSLIKLEGNTDKLKVRCLRYLLGMTGRNTFYNAFTWRETPEGHEFWRKINLAFLQHVYKE